MKSQKLLRNTLKINGFFSLLCGIDLLLFNTFFMDLLHVEHALVLPILGGGLIFFAATVLWTAYGKPIKPAMVWSIIYQDIAWVVASAIVVIGQFFALSAIGYELIIIVAVLVGAFAFFQYRGLETARS